MTVMQDVRLSKRLSYVLRHRPDAVGLTLDEHGWVPVASLLEVLRVKGNGVDRERLNAVVANCDKQRFEFDESGERIRARQGHSVDVDLAYSPETPPAHLYHGTATRFLESIRAGGLEKRKRHHVHLSEDRELMLAVGARHGDPVLLTIDAAAMDHDGHLFYKTENEVWLTDAVPPKYLTFPNLTLR